MIARIDLTEDCLNNVFINATSNATVHSDKNTKLEKHRQQYKD